MNHFDLRRLFRQKERRRSSNSEEEEEAAATVDMVDPKQKPKLERRNAVKNIDYAGLTSSSSSSSASSSDTVSTGLRTRSLDIIPFDKNISFRIEGVEGEFDRLCESLGLSGPEDFGIPAAAWEARKVRSISDVLPRSRFGQIDTLIKAEEEEERVEATVRVNDGAAESLDVSNTFNDSTTCLSSLTVSPSATAACGGAAGGGGGIKGIRPPLLTPPPLKSRFADDMSTASTWDIMRSFAPEERGSSSCPVRRLDSIASDKEEEEVGDGGEGEVCSDGEVGGRVKENENENENRVRLEETHVTSESPTFLTSNDEDSSSATTETTYNISPDGTFKRNITSWQRGDIIGSGSFGTVYEAFTE